MKAADLATLPERVMLDTNVLLTATGEDRKEYHEARRILDEWPDKGTTLATTGQILREYMSVATRPLAMNGLGLPTADAVRNARAFRERTVLVPEDGKVVNRLLALLSDVECGGRQIHDANVVAAMLAHDVGTVVTMNLTHFARFGTYVNLVTL